MDESNRSEKLRERSEEPTFVNLNGTENAGAAALLQPLYARRMYLYGLEKEAKEDMDALTEERKTYDAEILSILDDVKSDGVSQDGTLLDRVYNKGRESTDWNYLRKVLTPEQMATAKKSGTPYVYLKVTELRA